ncbi:acyltransferase family protein [Arthrobacter sedimenti]|uniref:Acyltransferase family protein n=1 Tax=Arthrobacter sedimenti TaxID=2694931 RepID=A0ABV8WGZ7_9MICC
MGNTSSTPVRLHSLDGLRGVAALVVLVSHIALTLPTFAAAIYNSDVRLEAGTWGWLATYTPLHLLWAGHEAVFVFFVLSGLVLTIPVIRRGGYSWREYYPKRLVRIYAPVAVAVLFGILMVLLVPRNDSTGMGEWLQDRPTNVSVSGVVKDLILVTGPSRLISPLWSLQWEMLFSLLLPAYVLFVSTRRGTVWVKAALILLTLSAGVLLDNQSLAYMPMFAAGSLMATKLDDLRDACTRMNTAHWWLVGGIASVLATARWTLPLVVPGDFAANISTIPAFIGCVLIVGIAAFCPDIQGFLRSRVVQWLGQISFSLYLTHEPIVIASAFFLGPKNALMVPIVAIPIAFAVAWAFFHLIEARSHTLSKKVGRIFRGKTPNHRSAHSGRVSLNRDH